MQDLVVLIRTPVAQLQFPPLALAQLSACLKREKIEVLSFDFAIEDPFTKEQSKILRNISNVTPALLNIVAHHPNNSIDDILSLCNRKESLFCTDIQSPIQRSVFIETLNKAEAYINNIARLIIEKKPKFIGFSLDENTALFSIWLASVLKRISPELTIILGGPDCALHFRGRIYRDLPFINFVVSGEGEEALLEIVRGQIINKSKLLASSLFKPVELNTLPFPDYSDFDLAKYKFGEIFLAYLSRGCVYNCKFCNERVIAGKKYRQKKIERFLEEFQHYQEKYGINKIYFCDSAVNSHPAQMAKMATFFQNENIKWFGEAVLRTASVSLCENMAKSGCRWAGVGIESGSDLILKKMNKGLSIESIHSGLNAFLNSGIKLATYWITGFPEETEVDFEASKKLITKLLDRIEVAMVFPCVLVPNSSLCNSTNELGISFEPQPVSPNYWQYENWPWHSRGFISWEQNKISLNFEKRLLRKKILENIVKARISTNVFDFPESLLHI